jgi:hypothetical protein
MNRNGAYRGREWHLRCSWDVRGRRTERRFRALNRIELTEAEQVEESGSVVAVRLDPEQHP